MTLFHGLEVKWPIDAGIDFEDFMTGFLDWGDFPGKAEGGRHWIWRRRNPQIIKGLLKKKPKSNRSK